MTGKCDECYYKSKVHAQASHIVRCNNACKRYKDRISDLEQSLRISEAVNNTMKQDLDEVLVRLHAYYLLPNCIRRFLEWIYSKKS